MFSQFENMVKGKINSLKQSTPTDITRSAQTYQIKGRSVRQIKLLSEGSFGFIWLAEDTNTKEKFALKRIVCVNNERYLLAKNQLDLMMKFTQHKNIVNCAGGQMVLLKNGNVENKVFIILMEYCPNGTLFDLLQTRQNKGFTQKQLVTIAHSILEGLKNIHKSGVYHQDIKIENVLVAADKTYKLCDFGSCSNRFIDFRSISKTQYNSIKEEIEAVTTPMYRPPEIVDPYLQYQVGYKVDLWMLGCVIYTLAYFTHPFVDSNAVGIAAGVYRFPKYPEQTTYQVSDKIKDLIRNLLTPNPTFRPSVDQALQIINSWHTLSDIPLNKEAKRRKEEQKTQEQEMQTLHKKVVDFDGDIPMQKLLAIQQKLKTKTVKEDEQKSFVTSNNTIRSNNQGKPLAAKVSASQNASSVQPKAQVQPSMVNSKQKQDTMAADSFWTTGSTNTASKTKQEPSKAVAFDDFFGGATTTTKPQPKTQAPSQNDMYDFFFAGNEQKAEQKPNQKKPAETNLLDL